MKIAAVTEDGTTISQHFGRAPYYLVVTDNGKGFQPPSELGSLVRREKLGLAIIEGLVRSAGGTLRIKSAAGEGTRVTIELPLDSSYFGGPLVGKVPTKGQVTQS